MKLDTVPLYEAIKLLEKIFSMFFANFQFQFLYSWKIRFDIQNLSLSETCIDEK